MRVKLNTCGLEYTASANTIEEALTNLGLNWDNIKGKGEITVSSRGKKSYTHLFTSLQLKRLFGNKLTKGLWSKRLETLHNLQ